MRGRKGAAVRTAVLVVGAMGVSVATSVYLARANPGQATAPALAFVGTLTRDGQAMTGPQALTFRFRKGGAEVCAPEVDSGPINSATGSFHALVPLGGCPGDLFDGSDVTFDVEVSGAVVARDSPVSAVPYAKYADQVGFPDCPVGYTRAAEPPNPTNPESILCRKGNDEVVRVGVGASAFWIDRYEAVLIRTADGMRVNDPSTLQEFPQTGKWLGTQPPAQAVSRRGEIPTENITWFQANEACRASGKRMPTGDEWFAAVRGTPDPDVSDGNTLGRCTTAGQSLRSTGIDTPTLNESCISAWGAEDMIGNAWEWTNEWHASLNTAPHSGTSNAATWPTGSIPGDVIGYGNDATYNILSHTIDYSGSDAQFTPSAALRGGGLTDGADAGTFAINANHAPSYRQAGVGFRCVIPR